jgi:hypothetical protein
MIKCTKEKIDGIYGPYDIWAIRFDEKVPNFEAISSVLRIMGFSYNKDIKAWVIGIGKIKHSQLDALGKKFSIIFDPPVNFQYKNKFIVPEAGVANYTIKKVPVKIGGHYYNVDTMIVYGDTFKFKNNLNRLGFRWDAAEREWRLGMKFTKFNTEEELKKLGINFIVSEVENDILETENEEVSKFLGFPINKNILAYDDSFNLDGKDYAVNVVIDRSYTQNAYKLPKYVIHLSVPTVNINYDLNINAKEKFGEYNESKFLEALKGLVKGGFLNKPDNALKKMIKEIKVAFNLKLYRR